MRCAALVIFVAFTASCGDDASPDASTDASRDSATDSAMADDVQSDTPSDAGGDVRLVDAGPADAPVDVFDAEPMWTARYFVDPTGRTDPDCVNAMGCGADACASVPYLAGQVELPAGTLVNLCPGRFEGGDVCFAADEGVTYRGVSGDPEDVLFRNTGVEGQCDTVLAGIGRGVVTVDAPNVRLEALTVVASGDLNGVMVGGDGDDLTMQNIHVRGDGGSCRTGIRVGRGGGATHDAVGSAPTEAAFRVRLLDSVVDAHECNWKALMWFRAPRALIQNNELFGCDADATSDCDNVALGNSDAFVVRGNRIHDETAGEQAFDVSRTGDNGSDCADYSAGLCSVGADNPDVGCLDDSDCQGGTCDRWVIEDNRIYNANSAIAFKQCAQWGTVRNNFLESSPGGVVRFESCAHDIQVTNNTAVQRGGASVLGLSNSYGTEFRNNIFARYDSSGGQVVAVDFRSMWLAESGLAPIVWDHNMVQNIDGSGARAIQVERQSAGGLPSPRVCATSGRSCDDAGDCEAGEACATSALSRRICTLSPRPQGSVANFNNEDVAAWVAADVFGDGPGGASSTGSGDVWAEPVFVDVAASVPDLHLSAGDTSGAIGGGTPIEGYARDIDGDARPAGDGWDIGADEVTD